MGETYSGGADSGKNEKDGAARSLGSFLKQKGDQKQRWRTRSKDIASTRHRTLDRPSPPPPIASHRHAQITAHKGS